MQLPLVLLLLSALLTPALRAAELTAEQVNASIEGAKQFLRQSQGNDGSWQGDPGPTALVLLALLTAGESRRSPTVTRGMAILEKATVETYGKTHNGTYGISLQTMVFAMHDPVRYRARIETNARWLEKGQNENGSWGYPGSPGRGDPSNAQYALLGLNAATEIGIPVDPKIYAKSRQYWEKIQNADGGFSYADAVKPRSYSSMTAAGISSLIISAHRGFQHDETIDRDGTIRGCAVHAVDEKLERAIAWLSEHFTVTQNYGWNANDDFKGSSSLVWRFYYLYGLERAGRFTGRRYFGGHDWYYVGAEELVRRQLPNFSWPNEEQGTTDTGTDVSTAFALLFLAKGKSPVLINKLSYGDTNAWRPDADDVKNLVAEVGNAWNRNSETISTFVWQVQHIERAPLDQLERAPILFINGHDELSLSDDAVAKIRQYLNRGGFLMADACCDRGKFDRSFRQLMKRVFPEPEIQLEPLDSSHPVWRMREQLTPGEYPLEGIDLGCRTVVIYSPKDLSCYWNQLEHYRNNPHVELARKLGMNIVDYFIGREPPNDKLTARVRKDARPEIAVRGALHIGKLVHPGRWNAAPLAVPTMMGLTKQKMRFDVVMNHRALSPLDAVLTNFPLLYLTGLDNFTYQKEEIGALQRHFDPGMGSLMADAACGSNPFDGAFRTLMKELFPKNPLRPIPIDDAIYTNAYGFDLSKLQYTPAMNDKKGFPALEGVEYEGNWAVVYSKYDLACALNATKEHQTDHCKGYTYESAAKIALNLIQYFTSPSPGVGPAGKPK